MALSLNKPKLVNLADDIWKSEERLRGKFKAYEHQETCTKLGIEVGDIQKLAANIESEIAILSAHHKTLIHESVTDQRRIREDDVKQVGATKWGPKKEQAA